MYLGGKLGTAVAIDCKKGPRKLGLVVGSWAS